MHARLRGSLSLLTLYQIISNMNHIDSRQLKWTAQVNVLLSNYRQNIKSLSLFVGTTVQMGVGPYQFS